MTTATATLPTSEADCRYVRFALEVQDACNLRAIVASWVRELDAARAAGIYGDELDHHPATRAFISKLNQLSGLTDETEGAAFDQCFDIVPPPLSSYSA